MLFAQVYFTVDILLNVEFVTLDNVVLKACAEVNFTVLFEVPCVLV